MNNLYNSFDKKRKNTYEKELNKLNTDMDEEKFPSKKISIIKNPSIPPSLQTPNPSQNDLLKMKKTSSKIVIDADLLNEKEELDDLDIQNNISYSQEIFRPSFNSLASKELFKEKEDKEENSRNSSNFLGRGGSQTNLNLSINRQKESKSNFNNNNSTNNNSNNIIKNAHNTKIRNINIAKAYSYRRPFSKNKRKFIFALLFTINILINCDHGAIPAGTTEIKIENNLSNIQLGFIGSLLYFGFIIGSFSGGYFFSAYSSKWIVIFSLFVDCFFLYSFTIIQSYGGMGICRICSGICEVFANIYFPVWVVQYGVCNMKTLWITFLQIGVPFGTMIGYIMEVFSIKKYDSWKGAFYVQIISLCVCNCILFLTPDKFFERNYRHSNTKQEDMKKEFLQFKELLSKKLGNNNSNNSNSNNKSNNRYLLNNMKLINDVYDNKYGRPSLYSIFSMVDFSEEEGNSKYYQIIFELLKNKKYLCTMIAISCTYFVVTGIQFWISDYMQVVMHLNSSKAYIIYLVVSTSAPIIGVLWGGFFIQRLGGYTNKNALESCYKISLIAAGCAILLPICNIAFFFVIFMWLLLFFGASITPTLTGIMISSIPQNNKEIGNSFTQFCYNLIGYLPSPFIYGVVCNYTGGEESKWGLTVILLWSFFCVIALLFAKNFNFEIEEENENENKENSIINIGEENGDFSNENSLKGRKFESDCSLYSYVRENNNNIFDDTNGVDSLKVTFLKNKNKDMLLTREFNFKEKTHLITSLFGRTSHI